MNQCLHDTESDIVMHFPILVLLATKRKSVELYGKRIVRQLWIRCCLWNTTQTELRPSNSSWVSKPAFSPLQSYVVEYNMVQFVFHLWHHQIMVLWLSMHIMINEWCFRPRFCTWRPFWARDNLIMPWRRIDRSTCWPAGQCATTVPRMPPIPWWPSSLGA